MATKLTDFGSIEAIISEMTLEEKARLVTGGSPLRPAQSSASASRPFGFWTAAPASTWYSITAIF